MCCVEKNPRVLGVLPGSVKKKRLFIYHSLSWKYVQIPSTRKILFLTIDAQVHTM